MHHASIQNPARLRLIFERIDASGEGSDIAFRKASEALDRAGIKWTDLLDAYLSACHADATPTIDKAFEDIFSSFAAEAFKSRQPQPAPVVRRRVVQGNDIPTTIVGRIKEMDRRSTRNGGTMLVVQVETANECYGPLTIFSHGDIELFDANPEAVFFGQVAKVVNPRHNPVLSRLRLW